MCFWVIILFAFVQLSTQTNYICNPNVLCGCSNNSTIVNRIVNGEAAEIGAWGWTVSLEIQRSFLCGGSAISRSWIITAAHCVKNLVASDVTVHAGSNTLWSLNQTRIASRVIVHPNYDSTFFLNDIALIQLISPLELNNSNIHIICLPSINSTILTNSEWPVANTTVVAVGWGRLSENGLVSSTLQQVTLQILNYQETTCSALIDDHRVQLCATVSNNTKDTCNGDSGGPLMMFSSNNQWVLVGLTSFGIGCARPGYPGVYTRVAAFQDWINATMNTAYILTPSSYYISFIIFLSILSFSTI